MSQDHYSNGQVRHIQCDARKARLVLVERDSWKRVAKLEWARAKNCQNCLDEILHLFGSEHAVIRQMVAGCKRRDADLREEAAKEISAYEVVYA